MQRFCRTTLLCVACIAATGCGDRSEDGQDRIALAISCGAVGQELELCRQGVERWSDIDASLPKTEILVMAPEPNTAAAIALAESALVPGCSTFPAIQSLEPIQRERVCRSMRLDGRVVNAAKLEDRVVQWLKQNGDAFALVSFTTYKEFEDTTAVNPIEGVAPSDATIANQRYPLVTGVYAYVKDRHVAVISDLQQFLYELTSERALAPDGYLADRGLVSLDDIGRNKARDQVLKLGM